MSGTYTRCTQNRRETQITHKRGIFTTLLEMGQQKDELVSKQALTKVKVNIDIYGVKEGASKLEVSGARLG